MNVIVDADRAGLFRKAVNQKGRRTRTHSRERGVAEPLIGWIGDGHGTIVYSNSDKYRKEIKPGTKIFELFASLRTDDKARLIDEVAIEQKKTQIDWNRSRSGDKYVLALALACDVRLLYSGDNKLKSDFTDRSILPNIGRKKRSVYPEASSLADRRRFLGRRQCHRG